MKINRETYESIFIDYLDGRLSDNDLRSLVDFLDENPDLEQELKDLTEFSKKTELYTKVEPSFSSKELIKTPIFDQKVSNFDELCIAFYEGLLNEKEEQYLLELSESREDLMLTFESYGQLKIKADTSIVFPNKSSLTKHKKIVWHQYASYAASLIFVLGFIFYIQGEKGVQQNNVPVNYSENKDSNIEVLKEESVKTDSYAYVENTETEVEELTQTNEQVSKKKDVQLAHKVTPVTYDQERLDDFEQHSPLSYSRKGKLAYTNISELEQYLSEVFAEKNIDKSFEQEETNEKKITQKENKLFLNDYKKLQIATSIEDPYLFRKRILGSQPAE